MLNFNTLDNDALAFWRTLKNYSSMINHPKPLNLLKCFVMIETDGDFWAVNVNGTGSSSSIDVGPLQLNSKYHKFDKRLRTVLSEQVRYAIEAYEYINYCLSRPAQFGFSIEEIAYIYYNRGNGSIFNKLSIEEIRNKYKRAFQILSEC